ncbi:MAG: FtsW/RodA/SpoVE family cell cycle protein [Bacillota bacterium]
MSSPDRINHYLDQVCAQIGCREMHAEIRAELSDHFQALLDTTASDEATQETAIEQALQCMGDPIEVGQRLDQAHRPRTDWAILALVGCLVSFGLVATFVLQAQRAMAQEEFLWRLLRPKLLGVVLGCAVAAWLFGQDYRRLQRYSWPLFYATVACMLWATRSDVAMNGIPQFVVVGGMTISIYAIAPYLLTTALAGIMPQWDWKQPLSSLKLALLLGGPVLIFLSAPSFTSLVVYTLGFMAVTWASGVRWQVVVGLPAALATVLILAREGLNPYRLQRLLIWLNPTRDPNGMGYLPMKVNQAVHSAGWAGRGIGASLRLGVPLTPELAVAGVIHAFGILMGVLITLLAVGFIYRMVTLAMEIKEPYGRVMVIGLSTLFSCQLILNLLMNGIVGVSIAPLLSNNIPFLAMSGSLFGVEMAAVGLMLAAYRRKDMIPRVKG